VGYKHCVWDQIFEVKNLVIDLSRPLLLGLGLGLPNGAGAPLRATDFFFAMVSASLNT